MSEYSEYFITNSNALHLIFGAEKGKCGERKQKGNNMYEKKRQKWSVSIEDRQPNKNGIISMRRSDKDGG